MRNLELVDVQRLNVPQLKDASQVTVTDDAIFIYNDKELWKYDRVTTISECIIKNIKVTTPMEFLKFENKLWFGVGNKFHFFINEKKFSNVEMSTSYNAASWNPQQEAIVVVGDNRSVTTYSIDSDLEIYTTLGSSNLDASPLEKQTVGWGDASTQFRGRLRRNSRKPEVIGLPPMNDAIRISWRPDGEMFVINYISAGERFFKVFEFPCVVLYAVADNIGLQHPIAWRPVRNLIAATSATVDRFEITMYDKGAEKVKAIKLDVEAPVVELKWSQCGEILAVRQMDGFTNYINLYTSKNFHWYLKQSLIFDCEVRVMSIEFVDETENLYSLRIITSVECLTYVFRKTIHTSFLSANDKATCAVIDGRKLYLTHFKDAIIPPPAYGHSVTTKSPINFVAFHPEDHTIAVVDSNYWVYLYDFTDSEVIMIKHFQIKVNDPSLLPLRMNHFIWSKPHALMCVAVHDVGNDISLYRHINLDNAKTEFTFEDNVGNVTSLVLSLNSDHLIKQTGSTICVILEQQTVELIELTERANYLTGVFIENKHYVFYITSSNSFYINDAKVADKVNNFIIHQNHLLLLTATNQLIGMQLTKNELETICASQSIAACYSRTVEAGGDLICGIPGQSDIIMQMPRGNLEIVKYPLIAIRQVEELLGNHRWKEAMDLLRIEKLNINLLVELDPDRFCQNIPRFFESVESAGIINSFLLALQNVNVLEETYKSCKISPPKKTSDKIDLVANAVLEYLRKSDYVTYISSVMVCYIVLSNSLGAVRFLRNILQKADELQELIDVVRDGVNTLKLYMPYQEIYKRALLTYDLRLAKFVADNIGMDPMEYQPFLLDLYSSSDSERRFKINHKVGNHEVAVEYLISVDGVSAERVLKYMRDYNLFKVVYRSAFRHIESLTLHKQVSIEYGQHLMSKGNYAEAATIFAKANYWEDAYYAYRRAYMWMEAISMLLKQDLSVYLLSLEYKQIADELVKVDRISEASIVYEDYCGYYEMSIEILIKHNMFDEALRLAQKYSRNDIIEKDINTAVVKYFDSLATNIHDMTENFTRYSKRLEAVRAKKIAKFSTQAEGPKANFAEDDGGDGADAFSDVGSIVSRMSMQSTRTTSTTTSVRYRRKKQSRIRDLREGGVYEDIALIRALHLLATEAFQLTCDVRNTTFLLLNMENMYGQANFLQTALMGLHASINCRVGVIWNYKLCDQTDTTNPEILAFRENYSELDEQYRKPPECPDFSWLNRMLDCEEDVSF